jgi:drug/metabolite transporter (DMT)-like permease
VFAVALGVLLLREPLLASMILGGLVTLVGVSLTNVARRTS